MLRFLFIAYLFIGTLNANVAINWSSNINSLNLNSQGQLFTSDYIFELGTFDTSFNPSDKSTWSSAWQPLDRVSYNSDQSFFGATTILTSNDSPFTAGGKAYIWGYRPSGEQGEWILISHSSWIWPTIGGISFPVDFLVDQSTEHIAGSINTGGTHMTTEAISSETTPVLSLSSWKELYFTPAEIVNPNISGNLMDPDFDGIINLIEYATGSNPAQTTSSQQGLLISITSSNLESITLRSSSIADSLMTIQESEQLNNFTNIGSDIALIESSPYSKTWTRPIATANGSKRFYRLKVTPNE